MPCDFSVSTDHIFDFVKGLKSPHVRQLVKEKHYPPGTKTLKAVADHAFTVETSDRERREENPNQRPPVAPKPKNIAANYSSASSASSTQGARPKTEVKGNKGIDALNDVRWRRSKLDQTHPMITSMQTKAIHHRYKDCNLGDLFKHFAKKLNNLRMEQVCFGCMRPGHQFALDFSKCGEKCPFCDIEYRSPKGHAALDCFNLPESAMRIEEVLKRKQNK